MQQLLQKLLQQQLHKLLQQLLQQLLQKLLQQLLQKLLQKLLQQQALTLARDAKLDTLAIDAVHMLALLDRAPADQLKWAQNALALCLGSTQAAAQGWQASIRSKLGCARRQ